ncbi:uncharacterized protein B0H18DRAFT_1130161 [Fomitopsis serialis]|uniref:uncharacterized protein n=1 Tax=Fomitopsis serialis TaxID=139415 RepID=UPI0020077AB5|nr:uncharacterized protein B0H18DRAFT_1130161 [Neoantrodia serialis]KAH9910422.1 hypothetical protein B0H18DRAFT_1130161 [Neoantrodia serialis]
MSLYSRSIPSFSLPSVDPPGQKHALPAPYNQPPFERGSLTDEIRLWLGTTFFLLHALPLTCIPMSWPTFPANFFAGVFKNETNVSAIGVTSGPLRSPAPPSIAINLLGLLYSTWVKHLVSPLARRKPSNDVYDRVPLEDIEDRRATDAAAALAI